MHDDYCVWHTIFNQSCLYDNNGTLAQNVPIVLFILVGRLPPLVLVFLSEVKVRNTFRVRHNITEVKLGIRVRVRVLWACFNILYIDTFSTGCFQGGHTLKPETRGLGR